MKYYLLFFLLILGRLLFAQDIVFRTNVENLRLRTQPNLESVIIKTVPKGTRLYWTGERSEQKTATDWKGAKVADYWYKVKFENDAMAWVFGKGIEYFGLRFGTFENPLMSQNIDNEWIKIEKVEEKDFQALKEIEVNWQENNKNTIKDKSKVVLQFENGKSKTFTNEAYGIVYITGTLKIENKTYYNIYFDGCMGQFLWIRKSDGKDMKDYNFPTFYSREKNGDYNINLPIFAPDKKTFIFESGCTYSDNNDC